MGNDEKAGEIWTCMGNHIKENLMSDMGNDEGGILEY